MASVKPAEPKISLVQNSLERNHSLARWSIGWSVENLGTEPMRILAVRLPHGQFKSEELEFEPPVDLAPGEGWQFSTSVRCDEPSGMVTENAFVIFHINWRGEPWRIFVRVRVVVNDNGEPNATTELITTQKVGFTGIIS